jgi:hypothetical protein
LLSKCREPPRSSHRWNFSSDRKRVDYSIALFFGSDEHFWAKGQCDASNQAKLHGCDVRQGLQFQMPVRIEAVNGLDEADHADGYKVIKFDLTTPPMEALRKKLYLPHMRKNRLFTMGWCYHGEFLLARREAAYAAAPSVDSAFDARSSRTMRCRRDVQGNLALEEGGSFRAARLTSEFPTLIRTECARAGSLALGHSLYYRWKSTTNFKMRRSYFSFARASVKAAAAGR